jgi:hypothetical protein
MKPDLQEPSPELLIDAYALASCAVLGLYVLSILLF